MSGIDAVIDPTVHGFTMHQLWHASDGIADKKAETILSKLLLSKS
jgi:hypothetical protein